MLLLEGPREPAMTTRRQSGRSPAMAYGAMGEWKNITQ